MRGDLSLETAQLLPISTGEQVCGRFGLHFGMQNLQRMYNDGDALFVANAGMLAEPTTKEDYLSRKAKLATPLFAHNTQSHYVQTVDGTDPAAPSAPHSPPTHYR